jgi:hypothetical protein
MRPYAKTLVLFAAAALLLFLPWAYLLRAERQSSSDDPVAVLTRYLRAIYSRDFKQSYRFISALDQRLKSERIYVRERGPFTGFALELARKLSEFIEFHPSQIKMDEDTARITVAFKAPDMNSAGTLLLDWDEERLNALSPSEQRKLLDSIDNLKRTGRLEIIDGQEEFALVKENNNWRLFLDWASGVRVSFTTLVPQNGLIEAKPTIKQTVTQRNELFTVAYRVKNLTGKDLFARINHRVEPAALAEHLDLVECALLLPVRILPGEEESYSSTYLIRGDLPDGTKQLNVTYEFKLER